jgi:hypothetical protein
MSIGADAPLTKEIMQAHLYDADANTFLEIAHRRPNCEWIDAAKFPAQNRGMAKKAAAQNGRADLPVSQDARQRVCDWHANQHDKAMLNQILVN